jgi:hypothetical protein
VSEVHVVERSHGLAITSPALVREGHRLVPVEGAGRLASLITAAGGEVPR